MAILGSTVLFSLETAVEEFPLKLIPRYKTGYVKILQRIYSSGAEADGFTNFDFINQGDQEILFPFQRSTLDIQAWDRHWITVVLPAHRNRHTNGRGAQRDGYRADE